MGKLFEEDRLGYYTLGDLVGAAGVDDGDVRDADEAEDHVEVRTFEVVGVQGRTFGVRAAAGDDDGDLLAAGETLEAVGPEGEGLVEADDVVDPGLENRGGR